MAQWRSALAYVGLTSVSRPFDVDTDAIETPHCRLCRAVLPKPFLDLGRQPLSNAYLAEAPSRHGLEQRYPLSVRICAGCGLVQIDDALPAHAIFDANYAYFSSFSDSWLAHCSRYVKSMIDRFDLGPTSQVIEVASNDGYLLQFFADANVPVLGIEPTANTAAAARVRGVRTEERFFNKATGRDLASRGLRGDLVHAANVLAHVPDLHDFIAGFPPALKPNGVLTLEFPHLLRLLEHVQFDTIYHEHFSYLSLRVVEHALSLHGLKVFDVEEWPTHGGSIRLFCSHLNATRQIAPAVEAMRLAERAAGLDRPETYECFSARVAEVRQRFVHFLAEAKRDGKKVAAYGAAAKGNTFLNSCGVSRDDIACVFDRNPHKQGKLLPGSHLPILSPEEIADVRPDYVLILPWNLQEEIVAQLATVRNWGARFVTAMPDVRVLDP